MYDGVLDAQQPRYPRFETHDRPLFFRQIEDVQLPRINVTERKEIRARERMKERAERWREEKRERERAEKGMS